MAAQSHPNKPIKRNATPTSKLDPTANVTFPSQSFPRPTGRASRKPIILSSRSPAKLAAPATNA